MAKGGGGCSGKDSGFGDGGASGFGEDGGFGDGGSSGFGDGGVSSGGGGSNQIGLDQLWIMQNSSEKQANLETPKAKAAVMATFKASASATRTEETEGREEDPFWITESCGFLIIHPTPQS
ncbi:predicted protein [Arabidopsis lyrata subsp. lyrata]|uniref:Predicted protein n=1 Tax=Arabidopsis lyrata subsp. lyrata TaxID=81972 RepID=D7KNT0_ARALL|nr:predicted protein [Arabidopsis lyrata subsp. lyrata]